jgi:hypothetical protein
VIHWLIHYWRGYWMILGMMGCFILGFAFGMVWQESEEK